MIENLVLGEKYKGGPKRKTHCKYGHSMDDAIQKFLNGKPNGRVCRSCRININKLYRENYPNKVYINRTNFKLRSMYAINSIAERDAILEKQGGKCAICGTSNCIWGKGGFKGVWHIDHRHDGTANHRGILCAECNHTIGRAKDDPELLRKMADYIESYQCKVPPYGWKCTREPGHDGPCAAIPVLKEQVML